MSIIRRVARPMLAAPFITGGIDVLRNPDPRAKMAAPVAARMAEVLPVPLPSDPVQLVQLDAGIKIVAGLLLATGRLPRLSALVLAGSMVPTTLAGHRFWEYADPQARTTHRVHVAKNLGLIGGLLITAARRRARRATKRARKALHDR
jgi:putative oxidoreductase